MKLRLLALALFFVNMIFAQSFHDTQGKLEISNSGQATYTLPIALPPSAKNVGPMINLAYVSGQLGGIAGQGWNISSVSMINRMATRKSIDGLVDGVDFDDNDKLALDGQRLLLKPNTGAYWADGSVYVTETQSNTKIELKGTGSSMYFIVTAPDGSRSWYGNYGGANAEDLTAFYIVRFEDAHGNYMTYHYVKPIAKSLCIDKIKFSANVNGVTPVNELKFNYVGAIRTESGYVKGVKVEKDALLKSIEVTTGGQLFRKYELEHIVDAQLGYQKVSKITEKNGLLEAANPVIFDYNISTATNVGSEATKSYTNHIDFTDVNLNGDFDGDGRIDFGTNTELYTKLFQETSGNAPVTFPQEMAGQKFAVNTLTNNKLNQFQSLGVLGGVNSQYLDFKIYNFNKNNNTFSFNYNKNVFLSDVPQGYITIPTFLEGDYNGDGISEAIIFTHSVQYITNPMDDPFGIIPPPPFVYGIRYLDLNPNASTVEGSSGFVKFDFATTPNFIGTKNFVLDFNGDGKTDILAVNATPDSPTMPYKQYKIYTFKQLTQAPWIEIEVIGQGVLDAYEKDKQILTGDFNGDGKADLMIPEGDGKSPNQKNWTIYYSNPKPAGGEFFEKELHTIAEYWPNSGTYFDSQIHFNSYYALDTNGDGKSDFVHVWRRHYKPSMTINDHDTEWKVKTYANNIGNSNVSGDKFTLEYTSPCRIVGAFTDCDHTNDSPEVPTPIVSNFRYAGLNRDMVMLRKHTNQVTYIDFKKDVLQDVLIQKVTSSFGEIVDEISYAPMEPTTSDNNELGALSDFYSSNNSVSYPFTEIAKSPNNYLVKELKNTTSGVVKKQDFKYHGFVGNIGGLGPIGFNKTARSAWYQLPSDKKIWSVTESDTENWRGAIKRTYTQLTDAYVNFSFVNSGNPTSIINGTTNNYVLTTTDNIFRLLLDKQITTDYMTGVSNETAYTYDPVYSLNTKTITSNKLNGVEQGVITVDNTYYHNPTGLDANYFIGKPYVSKTIMSAYAQADEVVGEKEYGYSNGFLTKIKTKGNTADNKYLVEDYEYDVYGNIKKLTKSSLGYVSQVLSPKSILYTFDISGRFVLTTTDIEGLVSTNNTFDPLYGVVTKSTNPYGQELKTEIDSWGKIKKITDFLGKSKNFTYTKTGNQLIIDQIGDDGSALKTVNDILGRTLKKGAKNIDGSWSFSSTEYDYLGRKIRESEPYTSTPNLWNKLSYDNYGRIYADEKATGHNTYITYSGTTVTAYDTVRTTSSTKNANGHMISSSDNGGVINFTYYADGKVKTSNYEGTEIKTEYDEWGNKIKMTDPSAGTYTYSYYSTGEPYKEKSPKGETTYNLDPATGKMIEKLVKGSTVDDFTDLKTTYVYDPVSKLLTLSTVTDAVNGVVTTYTNTYDGYKRLIGTVEENNVVKFETTTTYDLYGRSDVVTYKSTSKETVKSSTVATKNTYKNGVHWQIVDNVNPSKILWETKTVDARRNVTSGTYGNGINVTNTYDQYGFPTQKKHELGVTNPVNVMTLNTTFEPVQANLTSRYSSLFNITEKFQYDNLDRLTAWDGGATQSILNLPFNTTTDGFTFNSTSTGGSVTNSAGTLKVVLKSPWVAAQRVLPTGFAANDVLKVKATITNKTGTTGVIVNAIMVETDPNNSSNSMEYYIGAIENGTFDKNYTVNNYVSQNPLLTLKFVVDEASPEGSNGGGMVAPNTTFYVDNFKVDKEIYTTQTYDNKGRIVQNNVGTYTYDSNKKYQNLAIKSITPAEKTYYDTRGDLNITYNAFKAPVQIEEVGKDKLSFVYNGDQQRSAMYYGSLDTDKLARPNRRYYSIDGTMEISYNKNTGAVELLTFVGGDAYSAPVVVKNNGTTQNYFYLHRDYQGSILAITNDTGGVVEKRHFDAWGAIAKIQDGSGNNLAKLTFFERGYTGHEHLQSVGLIHMNGRLYDPKLHRFLQPDNYVQDPYNTQNYNRYGYVLNNPLKYTDPSGEVIQFGVAVLIGAVIAATTYTMTALLADVPFTVGGLFNATVMGAMTSAVTFGIGEATSTITQLGWRLSAQALAHGTFNGLVSGVQGGDFWTGFASGSVSSLVAGLWQGGATPNGQNCSWGGLGGQFGKTGVGAVLFATVSGGATASLTKGNFWQGATTGFTVSLLNHVAHSDGGQRKLRNVKIEVTDEIVGSTVLKGYPKGKDQIYETPLYKMTVSGTDDNGNAVSSDYKVTRFGMKVTGDGTEKVQTLAAGQYTIQEFYDSTTIPGGVFRISGPYLLHMGNITTPMGNNGCIAIYGGLQAWQNFLNDISIMSGSSNFTTVAKGGYINVNIVPTPTPVINRIR